MSIKEGDRIPDVKLKTNDAEGKPQDITTGDLFAGKKVVMFAVPGAFTPGCSNTHMPGFVVNADAIKSKGVDTVACMAVNDAFVMDAWQKSQNAEQILMLADGNGDLARALGLEKDATGGSMGMRSQRFAMIVDDGVVKFLGIDEKGVDESSAENVLKHL